MSLSSEKQFFNKLYLSSEIWCTTSVNIQILSSKNIVFQKSKQSLGVI